jgi:hypothetical protein
LSQRIARVPLRFKANVRVVVEHLLRDVSCDRHHCLVSRLRIGKFRDGLVAEVMKSETSKVAFEACNAGSAAGTGRAGILEESALCTPDCFG